MIAERILNLVDRAITTARGPLARQSATTFILRIVNIALGVTTTIILGRSLGVGGFGLFSVGFASATLLSGLFQASFSTHIMQTTASALAEQNWPLLNGIRNFAAYSAAIFSIAVYVVLTGALLSVGFETMSPVARAMIIGAAMAPLLFFDAAASSLLQGLSKISYAFIPQFAVAQSAFLGFIITAMFISELTAQTALLLFGASWALAAFTSWAWRIRHWPQAAKHFRSVIQVREWAAKTASILLAGLPNIVFGRLEVMLLAMISGPTAAGVYALAFRFAQFATLPSFAIDSGLAPAVSSLSAKGFWEIVLNRICTAARYTTLLTILFTFALQASVIVLFPIIHPEFASAALLVGVIALGYIIQAAAGRPLLLLVIKNKTSAAAIIGVASVGIGALLATVFVYWIGALGGAVSTALVNSVTAIALCRVLWRQCNLRSDLLFSAAQQPAAPAYTPTHKAAE